MSGVEQFSPYKRRNYCMTEQVQARRAFRSLLFFMNHSIQEQII